MHLPESVHQLVRQCAAESKAELVGIVMRGTYRKPVIEVFIDSPGAVTTDLCGEVSRRISGALEGKDLVSADYRLEVSSPGLDRPLKFLWQFPKHCGRPFRFTLADPPEGAELTGTLAAVDGDVLVVKGADGAERRVPFADVREARIVLPW